MNQVAIAVITLVIMLVLGGCIVFPMPHSRYESGPNPKKVAPERTTRAELIRKFGSPAAHTPDERFFLYDNLGGRLWDVCGGVLFPHDTGLGDCWTVGSSGWSRQLLLEFKENGVVKDEVIRNCKKVSCAGSAQEVLWTILEERHGQSQVTDYERLFDQADALTQAVERADRKAVRSLFTQGVDVNRRGRDFRTALLVATTEASRPMVQMLLTQGANANVQNKTADTPLHLAAARGDRHLAQLLLTHGANVNAKNSRGRTPLYPALASGDREVVKHLLRHGAEVNVQDTDDSTPLHAAAAGNDGDLVEQLLSHGAAVAAINQAGDTPLHVAAYEGNVNAAKALLTHGADPNVKRKGTRVRPLTLAVNAEDRAMVALLLAHGADANTKVWGSTALGWAVEQGDSDTVELLLTHGAVADDFAWSGEIPLHQAVMKDDRVMVELLLTHGADVNRQDASTGRTPLHWAAANNNTVLVKRLLEADADVDIQDADGSTPLDLATGQAALIIGSRTPFAQPPDQTSAYRVAIFPFGGPENCHGHNRPLNKKVASEVRELIEQNASLSVHYSYYDGSMNRPPIQKPDKLWSDDEPNVNLAYTLGEQYGVDAIVMHWRPSWGWGMGGYCTDRMPPYPIKVYLIDVKQRKTYQLEGREENRRVLTAQALNTFVGARSAHGRP